jgi:hypothetical protein
VAGCVLRSRSGATLTLGRKGDPFDGKEAIMTAAEQEIASRRGGPLTHLLDTGQPVIIGSLTVDQLGVSVRGRWQVSWQPRATASQRNSAWGSRRGAWSRRKRSDGWGCGWVLLLTLIFTGVVLITPIPGLWHLIVMVTYGAGRPADSRIAHVAGATVPLRGRDRPVRQPGA